MFALDSALVGSLVNAVAVIVGPILVLIVARWHHQDNHRKNGAT